MAEPQRNLKMPDRAEIYMDEDVELVLKFMVMNIHAEKLISVAKTVYQLSEVMFERYLKEATSLERFIPLGLRPRRHQVDHSEK